MRTGGACTAAPSLEVKHETAAEEHLDVVTPLKSKRVSMSVSSARRDPGWLFCSTRAYLVSSDVNWKPLQCDSRLLANDYF